MRPIEAEGPLDLSLSIETADAAADAQPPTHERLARATLQACSSACVVPRAPCPVPLALHAPRPTPHARTPHGSLHLAPACVQAALAATGVPLCDIEALEVPDRSSAAKVYW